MRERREILLIVLIIGSMIGCDRWDGLDEGDRNTYTRRGTLYKGYSDEVKPNMQVKLRYERSGITGGSSGVEEELGEAVTDENGYFTITYRRLNRSGGKVLLYAGSQGDGNLIYRGDLNKSYFTDFAMTPHIRIDFKVEGLEADSLIITPPVLYEAENRLNLDLEPASAGKHVLITQEAKDQYIQMICGPGANIPSERLVWRAHYYLGTQDYRNTANPDYDYKHIDRDLSGFPKRDTVILDLRE
jgi:hypothetical protein